jgi:hypothetical protein
MVEIDLSESETKTLIAAIESYLSDLRMEITDTDSMDYREILKDRKEKLMKILDTLRRAEGISD